jgi:acyl carrier protein
MLAACLSLIVPYGCDSSQANVAGRVKAKIVRVLDVSADQVLDSARFVQDLGADSLDCVELITAFEEEFGIEIPDEAAEKFMTVGDAVRFIENARSHGIP